VVEMLRGATGLGSNLFCAALRVEPDEDDRPPADEAEPGPQRPAQLVEVVHAESTGRVFGHPFLLRVAEGASGADIRAQLQAKLGVPDGELSQWRLRVATPRELTESESVSRDDKPLGERLRDGDLLPLRSLERGGSAGGPLAWSSLADALVIERPHPARLARSPTAGRGLRGQRPLTIRAAAR